MKTFEYNIRRLNGINDECLSLDFLLLTFIKKINTETHGVKSSTKEPFGTLYIEFSKFPNKIV